jgi:hypothetical protein
MQFDVHGRARFLIDEALAAEISADDRAWLRAHTEGCVECARYEETTARIVRALGSFAFDGAVPKRISSARPRRRSWRWALAAAALVVLAAAPVYQSVREARRDRADTLLLEGIGTRVSRRVPAAMEPLMAPAVGENQ